MNTLTSGMIRGLKGAPASIILLLMCVRQPVSNAWLVANSGYTDKPIALALAYLMEQGLVIQVHGGWRLAGDARQLPFLLPAADDLPHTDDNVDKVVITSTSRNESDSAYVVGVVKSNESDLSQDSVKHQHQHGESRNNSDSPEPELSDDATRAGNLLVRLGCWDNAILKILAGLHPYRGLGVVLGWIAYAGSPSNDLRRPAAVIATNLRDRLEPSSHWVAPRICRACHLAEGRCECGAADWHYPLDFDDLAFERPPNYWGPSVIEDWEKNRWSCTACGGHPCRCDTEETDT